MAKSTHLRFYEAWLIRGPMGNFVIDPLSSGVITDYVDKKEEAKIYSSYEDASLRIKTLDMCIKKGHTLVRFYIDSAFLP